MFINNDLVYDFLRFPAKLIGRKLPKFTTVPTFPCFLKQLRNKRNLRQKQLAYLLGYEPSYLSALERGVKGPPRQDFIHRLIQGLALDEFEQAQLHEAIRASRRHFSVPRYLSEAELHLVHQLEPQLGKLTAIQIKLIELALAIPADRPRQHGFPNSNERGQP